MQREDNQVDVRFFGHQHQRWASGYIRNMHNTEFKRVNIRLKKPDYFLRTTAGWYIKYSQHICNDQRIKEKANIKQLNSFNNANKSAY